MKLRKPPVDCVWIHIDRLDRADGRVWAIQTPEKYRTAKAVILEAQGYTQFFGISAGQPRAVICAPGASVRLKNGIATVFKRGGG